ncbi:MAG TPA: hypothetical protein PLQ89_02975 [Phycisphaerae bacterium]|nr:hypothetical protein [Phycisphaerae bacterium]
MRASRMRFAFCAIIALALSTPSTGLAATVAHWRFEEGPAGTNVPRGGLADGVFYPAITDSSGNGNHLSAWSDGGCCGYIFSTDVPGDTLLQTGAANNLSVQNSGVAPGMFTETGAPIQSISPAAFTIEASFKAQTGGYRTIVGRDSQGAIPNAQDLAAVYLQLVPGDAIAIKFADVSGYWHQAVSAPGTVQCYEPPNTEEGRWYHVAAVSNGHLLSLYLNDVAAGTGYQLVAQTNMTLSGSPNTALTAGTGDGGDWDAGNWSVGRGLHNGNHVDRFYGFIDEVRISDTAMTPSQFLFAEPTGVMEITPATFSVAAVDPPVSVSVVIPESCNATQAVNVTVTSDAPAVAKPAGSQGSTVVHFPAGGPNTALLPIEFGEGGEARFTLSATGCPSGPDAALAVTVNAAESIDLVIPNHVMRVGLTQQAIVTANFGVPGTRDVTAASFGTTYEVTPAGVISVDADGLITALALGAATITATYGGIESAPQTITVMPPDQTVAYWRFEEGPLDANVRRGGQPDGAFFPGVADSSGNGNTLSAWSDGGFAGFAYRANVPDTTIPKTGEANNFSVQNTGGLPGMFTQTGAPIQKISPAQWTIEASFMPEAHTHNRTIVGRDSQGAAVQDAALAALYLQILGNGAMAIKFADDAGYWHEAVSEPGLIQGWPFPNVDAGRWYHVAAVSDGSTLSLYVDDVEAGTGYQLVAQTDLTASGSPNTALTAGMGDGSDWDAGNWSVGRGLHNGSHTDRMYGFIDEVRISAAALQPSEFLFAPEYTVIWPSRLDVAPIDAPRTVSLVLPSSCNETQAVEVTITSDNPAVAKPVGSNGSTVIQFPAGNGRLQPVDIEFGETGVANFTLSATGGCATVPGAALTVTVHEAASIDLQIIHDLMIVGGTQQARLVADFGAAGTRDVAVAATGTTYSVNPQGIVTVSPDGLITALDLGTAGVTATFRGLTSAEHFIDVKPANKLKVAGSGVLLVDLSALDATAGQATWVNKGSLGDFVAIGQPVLETVAGELAVTFNGADGYQGPLAPVELRGGQGRTIEVWVYNPSLDGEVEGERIETMVSWGHRGGPDGSLLTFNFGDHPEWGAAGQWGSAKDVPWNPNGPGSPPVGEWRHLVYTYDPDLDGGTTRLYDNGVLVNSKVTGEMSTHPGHINLCRQNRSAAANDLHDLEIGTLSLAVVRVHDGALSAEDVEFNFRAGITGRGQVPPDMNLDGHVDGTDVALFSECAAGPEMELVGDCIAADFDNDGDADQLDFAILQRCITGPIIEASAACLP